MEDYLQTSYRPDREYVDGEIQERNLGEYEHARLQAYLVSFFLVREDQYRLRVLPEQRFKVSQSRYRVPGLCLVPHTQKRRQILVEPPAIIVESLSPEDRLSRVQERVTDYTNAGVRHIWLIDPVQQVVYECSREVHQIADGILRADEYGVVLPVPELFAKLNAEE